jgi:hypothetical protein
VRRGVCAVACALWRVRCGVCAVACALYFSQLCVCYAGEVHGSLSKAAQKMRTLACRADATAHTP